MELFTLKIDLTERGNGPGIIAALKETLARLEKLNENNTTQTLFDELHHGHIVHDDSGNTCGTFGIITKDDELRGVRGDARELASYVLYDDMTTDAPEKREGLARMRELAARVYQGTDAPPLEHKYRLEDENYDYGTRTISEHLREFADNIDDLAESIHERQDETQPTFALADMMQHLANLLDPSHTMATCAHDGERIRTAGGNEKCAACGWFLSMVPQPAGER